MKSRNDYAFEVCYDTTGAVVDHSELCFSDLPDAGQFETWLKEATAAGTAAGVRIVQHHADLLPAFRRWVMSPKATSRSFSLTRNSNSSGGRPIGAPAFFSSRARAIRKSARCF